jgi:hypothetical protein
MIADTIFRFSGTEVTQEIGFAQDLKLAPREAHISRDYSQDVSAQVTSSPSWFAITGDTKILAKLTKPKVLTKRMITHLIN